MVLELFERNKNTFYDTLEFLFAITCMQIIYRISLQSSPKTKKSIFFYIIFFLNTMYK